MKNLTLPVEIRKNNLRAARELPNDLTTGSTRRRQRFRVGDHRKLSKLSFTFRQRLPDRDSLRANRQAITRTLNVAARIDFAAARAYRRANEKPRKRRD